MKSFFFEGGEAQLYGVLHLPEENLQVSHGVVLCQPIHHEYMLAHWAFRRLASHLARAGIPTLRFDYSGTGDSSGVTGTALPSAWVEDVARACGALTELVHPDKVSLVGYRLGGTLAWLATHRLPSRARHLVLWDPVVDGKDFVDEVSRNDASDASRLLRFRRPPSPPRQLGGHAVSETQRLALEALSLVDAPAPAATRVHLLVSDATGAQSALRSKLETQVKRASFAQVTDPGARGTGALLPSAMLEAITRVLAPEAP